jgi:hypothetical protein
MHNLKKYLPPTLIIVATVVVSFTSLTSKSNELARPDLDKSTWQTYADNLLEIKYPSSWSRFKSGDRVYFDEGNIAKMEVVRNSFGQDLSQYKYLGFIAVEEITIGNKKFREFKAPQGYCVNNSCGRPFSAYSYKQGDNIFTMIFYENDELSPQEKAILETFSPK